LCGVVLPSSSRQAGGGKRTSAANIGPVAGGSTTKGSWTSCRALGTLEFRSEHNICQNLRHN
jgi:hypothetical protein